MLAVFLFVCVDVTDDVLLRPGAVLAVFLFVCVDVTDDVLLRPAWCSLCFYLSVLMLQMMCC